MAKIISRREAYGSQSGEKGADVRLGAGDAPLREAVASAAAAMERRVHVLDQSADVLPGVDDRVVIRAVRAREDGAAPAADLRRGARSPHSSSRRTPSRNFWQLRNFTSPTSPLRMTCVPQQAHRSAPGKPVSRTGPSRAFLLR